MNNIEFIGNKIKELRKKKKISQESLAEMIGMNHRSIIRLENKHSIPTIDTLSKIANALEVNIADFFSNETSKDKDEIIEQIDTILRKMNEKELKIFYKAIYHFIT